MAFVAINHLLSSDDVGTRRNGDNRLVKVNTDVDIDVFNRDVLLEKLQHVTARIKRNGDEYVKHNTGVYFQRIPYDPITNIATIDHKMRMILGT